jgi:hypothetical protein
MNAPLELVSKETGDRVDAHLGSASSSAALAIKSTDDVATNLSRVRTPSIGLYRSHLSPPTCIDPQTRHCLHRHPHELQRHNGLVPPQRRRDFAQCPLRRDVAVPEAITGCDFLGRVQYVLAFPIPPPTSGVVVRRQTQGTCLLCIILTERSPRPHNLRTPLRIMGPPPRLPSLLHFAHPLHASLRPRTFLGRVSFLPVHAGVRGGSAADGVWGSILRCVQGVGTEGSGGYDARADE